MGRCDITVMGAGIFGLSIAWAAVRRGARVQVIDPGGPGAGASGGILGALAPHVPEAWNEKKAFQLRSLLMAETFWAEVAATGGGDPGYARTGRLQPLADAAAIARAEARAQSARALWGSAAEWRVIPASEAGPWAPEFPGGALVHDTLSARLHPARACAALAAALRVRGTQLRCEGEAQGQVIWATGAADLAAISAARPRLFGAPIKGQAAMLRLAGSPPPANAPQLFADGLHVIPHADGLVAVGSTTERVFADPISTDAQLDDIVAKAKAAVPALRGAEVVQRWAGLRPRARSRAPVLGPHPLHPGAFIANGGFKIGFGMAPLVGEVMADLVLEGRDAIPDAFRVESCL